jgi:hypothetical protein
MPATKPATLLTYPLKSYYASGWAGFAAKINVIQVGPRFRRLIRLRPRVLHPIDFSCAKSHEPPSWAQHRLERADRMLLRRRPFSERLASSSCEARPIAGARIGRSHVPTRLKGTYANEPGKRRCTHNAGKRSKQDIVCYRGLLDFQQCRSRTSGGDVPG